MTSSFNPYRKWLGIPERELPPHYYRLLGLELFESEPSVISSAIDRQTNHLKSHRGGEHARLAELLIEEVKTAGRCLLTAELKAVYDAGLRQRLVEESRDPANGATPEVDSPVPNHQVNDPSKAAPARPIPVAVATVSTSGGDDSIFEPGAVGGPVRPRRRRSLAVGILGHVIAPLLGLAIGYLILVFAVGRQHDFLGLFKESDTDSNKTAGREATALNSKEQNAVRQAEDQKAGKVADNKPSKQSAVDDALARVDQIVAERKKPTQRTPDEFAQAERNLWQHLGAGNLPAAKQSLNTLGVQATDPNRKTVHERLRFLIGNVEQANQAIELALTNLKPGDELQIGETLVVVVQSDTASLTVRSGGQIYTFQSKGFPLPLALALLAHDGRENDPLIAQWSGALHLTRSEGRRSEAHRLWTLASASRQMPAGTMQLISQSPLPNGDGRPAVALFPRAVGAKDSSKAPAQEPLHAQTPSAVDLPAAGPQLVALMSLPHEKCSLQLVCLTNDAKQPLFDLAPAADDPQIWLVQNAKGPQQAVHRAAVARFAIEQGVLKFKWETGAPSSADQLLRNSVLRIMSPLRTFDVALRKAVGHAPLKLDLEQKTASHEIELEHAPPMDALRMELLRVDNITPAVKTSQTVLAPGEGLTLSYTEFPAVETRLFLVKSAAAPSIRIATVFRLGKQLPAEMTTKKVNGLKDVLTKKMETMNADLEDREQYLTVLPAKLNAARNIVINPNTPGAPVQQMNKNQTIKNVQRDIYKTEKAIAALKRGIPLAKASLDELTKIATFGNRLNGQVMLQFRLFIELGEHELTLASSQIN